MNELLQWNAAATSLPDADITVLMWVQYPDDGISREHDWASGWWDGEVWRDAGSAMIVIGKVTHWAEPNGPGHGSCNGCDAERLRAAITRACAGYPQETAPTCVVILREALGTNDG